MVTPSKNQSKGKSNGPGQTRKTAHPIWSDEIGFCFTKTDQETLYIISSPHLHHGVIRKEGVTKFQWHWVFACCVSVNQLSRSQSAKNRDITGTQQLTQKTLSNEIGGFGGDLSFILLLYVCQFNLIQIWFTSCFIIKVHWACRHFSFFKAQSWATCLLQSRLYR